MQNVFAAGKSKRKSDAIDYNWNHEKKYQKQWSKKHEINNACMNYFQ